MIMNFSKDEVVKIMEDHFKQQGFPMKQKSLDVRFKSRFRGKGQGQEYTLVVDIQDLSTEEIEPNKETLPTTPIFGSDE